MLYQLPIDFSINKMNYSDKKLMTQNNVEQRLLEAGKWTIVGVSLLVIFIVAVFLCGYYSMHGSDKVKTWLGTYACGKFGDQQLLIDKRYLYWGMVNYQDVNYWGKNVKENHSAKGCNDQIQSVDFTVKWPEMSVSKEGFSLGSSNKHDITSSLHQRSVWKDEWGSKDFFNHKILLKSLLREGVFSSGEEVSEEWMHATKKFNSNVDLYEVEVETGSDTTKTVYWQEIKGEGVSLVIECLFFKSGSTRCKLTIHQPNYGFNTSYITIDFHSDLLPHWKEVLQHSKKLIDSFNATEPKN